MKPAEFIAEMQKRGWELDRWGNLQKDVHAVDKITKEESTRRLRLKIQKTTVRVERQVIYAATQYTKEEKAWIRMDSDYFKYITMENGVIKVGRYKFNPPKES